MTKIVNCEKPRDCVAGAMRNRKRSWPAFRPRDAVSGLFQSPAPSPPPPLQLLSQRGAVQAELLRGGQTLTAVMPQNGLQQRRLDDGQQSLVEVGGLRAAPCNCSSVHCRTISARASSRDAAGGDRRRDWAAASAPGRSRRRGPTPRRARWRCAAPARCRTRAGPPTRPAASAEIADRGQPFLAANNSAKCSASGRMSSRRCAQRRQVDLERRPGGSTSRGGTRRRPRGRKAADGWPK